MMNRIAHWWLWALTTSVIKFVNTQVNTANAVNLGTPQRRIIAVNGSGGAYVLISASIFAGYAEITECAADGGGALTAQGLNVQRADENYVHTYGLSPGDIWTIGDAIAKSHLEGVPGFTYPDGVARPPTPWVKVRSQSATATNILVTEWRQQGGV